MNNRIGNAAIGYIRQVALILLPPSVVILCRAHQHGRDWNFNDVKALFVLTEALLIVLGVVAIAQLVRLVVKRIAVG